jgi:hypothetical protein
MVRSNGNEFHLAQLNIYKNFNNQLFVLQNLENELIIYVRNNLVYAPKCVIVTSIEVIADSNLCFKDIPIRFLKDNKTTLGFLTTNRIIKLTSNNITCSGLQSIVFLSNSLALEYTNNKVKLIDSRKDLNPLVQLKIHTLGDPNFHHS